jgi:TPR repeat protein
MFKKLLFLAVLLRVFISFLPGMAAAQTPSSEEAKTRLDKKEITDLILKIGNMPGAQQNSGIDRIASNPSGSKTPRSDFTFCTGLAFLGNHKAQRCVGYAYEHGLGIVEDAIDAYMWYTIALENSAGDAAAKKKLQEDIERITLKLRSVYPSPSNEELDDLIKTQKMQIGQYRDEAKKANK